MRSPTPRALADELEGGQKAWYPHEPRAFLTLPVGVGQSMSVIRHAKRILNGILCTVALLYSASPRAKDNRVTHGRLTWMRFVLRTQP
jgi:hypothetical protein